MSLVNQSRAEAQHARDFPAVFRLSQEFVSKLSAVIQRIDASERDSPTGITGVLLGHLDHDLILVQTFRPFTFYDQQNGHLVPGNYLDAALERLLARSKSESELASPPELIGWFCLRAGQRNGLLDTDIALHNRLFARPTDLALFLRPEKHESVSADFYARSANGVLSREEHRYGSVTLNGESVAKPIDVMLSEKTVTTTPAPQASLSLSRSESSPSQLSPKERVRRLTHEGVLSPFAKASPFDRKKLSWISALLIFAISGGCTFAWMYMRTTSSRPSNARRLLPATTSTTDLGMKVEGQGDRLLVTWNRDIPAVHSVNFGMLFVDDGQQHHEIVLAPAEVATGSVLYRPAANEVAFRLELMQKQGPPITQSVRVLDGSSSAPLLAAASDSRPEPATEFTALPGDSRNQREPTAINGPEVSSVPESDRFHHPPAAGADRGAETRETTPAEKAHFPSAEQPPSRALPDLSSSKIAELRETKPDGNGGPKEQVPLTPSTSSSGTSNSPQPKDVKQLDSDLRPTAQSNPGPLISDLKPASNSPEPPRAPNIKAAVLPDGIETVPSSQQIVEIEPLPNISLPEPPPKSLESGSHKSAAPKLAWNDALPKPVKQVLPNLNILASSSANGFTPIKVSIRVDEYGHVTSVRPMGKDAKRNKLLATEAVNAAKQWTFEPKKNHDKNVPCDFVMVFRFNSAPH